MGKADHKNAMLLRDDEGNRSWPVPFAFDFIGVWPHNAAGSLTSLSLCIEGKRVQIPRDRVTVTAGQPRRAWPCAMFRVKASPASKAFTKRPVFRSIGSDDRAFLNCRSRMGAF